MSTKLDAGTKHLLRLIDRDKDSEGWTKISKVVWPFIVKLPSDLVIVRPSEDGGHAQLTKQCSDMLHYIL